MRSWLVRVVIVGLCVLSPVLAGTEELSIADDPVYYDQNDVWCVFGFKPPPPAMRASDFTIVPGPYFGMNPTSGTIWGLGANGLFYAGDPATTRMSTIDSLLAYTTKNHFLYYSRSTVMSANNDWIFSGDWRFYNFSQPTFTLGTDNEIASSELIRFSHFRWHEIAYRRLAGNLYAGLGCNLDFHRGIEVVAEDGNAIPLPGSIQAAYGRQHGFSPEQYSTSGVNLNVLYESRDHVLNPYQGEYARLACMFNSTALGSTQNSQVLSAEYRRYFPLSNEPTRHLIGIWAYTQMVIQGNLPYLDLPASGNDQRERSGRGYTQGRWRGTQLAYLEAEYRFPLRADGLLGGVLFANATSAARPESANPESVLPDPGAGLFAYIKPAIGAGLRLMLVKSIRMNVEMDVAWGAAGPASVYLNLFEVF
ncbi:BamA/TamA family outer membrane protein [candidate division FCPU426 bacterium]|nr:BamA/TamA family outer membrane protein [candidate division FCPU426 bacterium]